MRKSKLRMAGVLAMVLGIMSAMAIPGDVTTKDSSGQEITVKEIIDSLYFEGRIFLPINFTDGKAAIQEDSRPLIDNIVSAMNLNPGFGVTVVGYDFSSGETSAEDRARAVIESVIAQGIDAGRLTARGAGKDKALTGAGSIELVIKPFLPQDSIPPVPATQHFGIQVYPGAQFDDEQTRFVRNIYGINEYVYTTSDNLKKVVDFYKGFEGFMPLDDADTSAAFMKITDNGMLKVSLAGPWTDLKTGEVKSSTLLQIMGGE